MAAVPIGIAASLAGYYAMLGFKTKLGFDDSLDVFAVHGLGGLLGMLAIGVFASLAVNPAGADGLIAGSGAQMLKQLVAAASVGIYSFGVTWVLAKLLDVTIGLRVRQAEETIGLDLSQHGERAYGGLLR